MSPTPQREGDVPAAVQPIEEVVFDPARNRAERLGGRQVAMWFVGGALGVLLLGVLWFVFTARSVHVDVAPIADRVSFESESLQFKLGDRYLVRSGAARVQAQKAGYFPLDEAVVVGGDSNQIFRYTLQKKPGILTIEFDREVLDAVVTVAGQPFTGLRSELPAGEHSLSISAPRFQPFSTSIEIEGAEVEQTLSVSLTPDWADVSFQSMPAGAEIVVDGEVFGVTPGTVEILSGLHDVSVRARGHKPWRRPVRAIATQPQEFRSIVLEKADGLLSVLSNPARASVAVDGRYKGQTPIDLRLPPGKRYSLTVSRSGFASATRAVTVRADNDVSLNFDLDPLYGDVVFKMTPAGAQVFVDDQLQTLTDGKLSLPASEQTIEVRALGYVTQTHSLIPNPAYAQTVSATLITREAAREAAIKRSLQTGDGQTLALMRPGPFSMGASRRERGRRANEVLRDINNLPEFYVATTEVTNKRFKAFDPTHESGFVYKVSLDEPNTPVVNVTVRQAIEYCNWLSEKDGLEPAYKIEGDDFARTGGSGYRLPSEAEWAWAARYAGQVRPPRFPWGNDMPPAPDSGNYADRATIGLTALTLKNYSDGFAATAPVASFAENAAGLFDIGGNVSEWTDDEYAVGVAAAAADGGGTYYVVRGSSWMHSDLSELRMTSRDFSDVGRPDVGFRIVRSVEEPEL